MNNNNKSSNDSNNINKLPKKLPDNIKKLIEDLPPNKQDDIIKEISFYYKGISSSKITIYNPLPLPHILKEYEKILPKSVEKIFLMTKKQSDHRRNLENLSITSDKRHDKRAQLFAFIITIISLLLAGFLGYLEQIILPGIICTITIATLVSFFFIGRKKQREELDEKDIDLEEE